MKIDLVVLILSIATAIFATVYNVDGIAFVNIGDVPWESLVAGDTVKIFARPEPYREKWVICRVGSESAPIVVLGVPDGLGNLPVIDGRDATTRSALNFWNEERGIIKIGGANSPPDAMPAHIIIENLDIRSGRPPYGFTGRFGASSYVSNCAAVYIEKGQHLTIRGCILRDCGNGLFCGNLAADVKIIGNYIYDNGIEGSAYEHNTYTEAFGIRYSFNRFGPPRAGCDGNNLKDRSAGAIIEYNWIEGGNRQLDLVDSNSPEFIADSSYRKTFVYGNILIEREGDGNSQIIHYGGDSGDTTRYRHGTLYLYNNTIFSERTTNTTFLRMSSDLESCDARNNIVQTVAAGARMAILNSAGTITLTANWLPLGWVPAHSTMTGSIINLGNIEGATPGFTDQAAHNFFLNSSSACIDSGTLLAGLPEPVYEYVPHLGSRPRYNDGHIDIGAFEFNPGTTIAEKIPAEKFPLKIYPNPFNKSLRAQLPGVGAGNARPEAVGIKIFDTRGKLVADRLVPSCALAQEGPTPEIWSPAECADSGVYLIRVEIGGSDFVGKAVYIK